MFLPTLKSAKLSYLDEFMINTETKNNPCTITTIFKMAGVFESEEAFESIIQEKMVNRFERFRSIIVPRKSMWKNYFQTAPIFDFTLDTQFNIKNHISHVKLLDHFSVVDSENLEEEHYEMLLKKFAAELQSKYLNWEDSKPLWHVYVIRDCKQGDVMIFHYHHSLADGISFSLVFDSLADNPTIVPQYKTMIEEEQKRNQNHTSTNPVLYFLQQLWYYITTTVFLLLGYLVVSWKWTRELLQGAQPEFFLNQLPLTGRKKVEWITNMSVTKLKQVAKYYSNLQQKKKDSITLNDIFLAMLSASLSEYHSQHPSKVPINQIRMSVPVNLRDLNDMEWITQTGNLIGQFTLNLPLQSDMSWNKRIEFVHWQSKFAKYFPESYFSLLVVLCLEMLGTYINHDLLLKFFGWFSHYSIMLNCSNVKTRDTVMYVSGVPIKQVDCLIPSPNSIGASFCYVTYKDEATFAMQVDESEPIDVTKFAHIFAEQYEKLMQVIDSSHSVS